MKSNSTPQDAAFAVLDRAGYELVNAFPFSPDPDNDSKVWIAQCGEPGRVGSRQCEIDPDGFVNGLPVADYMSRFHS